MNLIEGLWSRVDLPDGISPNVALAMELVFFSAIGQCVILVNAARRSGDPRSLDNLLSSLQEEFVNRMIRETESRRDH